MKPKISWIADVDSSKVSVFRLVQTMSSRKPGIYLLGRGKSNSNPHVVGVYFGDTALSEGRPIQTNVVRYVDHILN